MQITIRADEELTRVLEGIMKEYDLNQSKAISFLAKCYANPESNCNPYYRKMLAKFSMDMENALNLVAETGNIEYARKELSELECLMLL